MGEALTNVVWLRSGAKSERTIEELLAELLPAARRRTAMDPERFAAELNARSARHPGLIGGAIRAAEAGVHPLPADLMAHAVTMGGIDTAGVLATLLAALA